MYFISIAEAISSIDDNFTIIFANVEKNYLRVIIIFRATVALLVAWLADF